MATVHDATLTLGETARRLAVTVDGVLKLIYDGTLSAEPQRATGRMLVKAADVEVLRRQPD